MRRVIMAILFGSSLTFTSAQTAETSLVSFSSNDKIEIARSSIDVPTWHEKSFWPLYEKYVEASEELLNRNVRLRHSLARLDSKTSAQDASTIGKDIFAVDNQSLKLKKEYYQKVNDELAGMLSLQFLQGEVIMDMMESAKVYEGSALKKFKFHPKATSDEQYNKAKHKIIYTALGLTKDNDYVFWNIYNVYEQEVDDLLGKDYSLISFYAGPANDFTPAIAKRLGQDLISVMERELKLKEKYYAKFNEQMGPVLAAKFLAWEDYYSLISKMHAWAEAQ
jgi:hypothetical protein